MSLPSFPCPLPMLSGEWVGFEEAMAWVQTRDAAFAEEMQDEDSAYRAVAAAVREVVEGHSAPLDDEDQARRKLLQVLRHGIVAAQGRRDARDAPLEPISTAEWSGLRFGSDAWGNLIAMPGKSRAGGSVWFDLTFRADSLLRAIPEPRLFGGLAEAMAAALAAPSVVTIEHVPDKPPHSPEAEEEAPTAGGERQCQRWLQSLMAAAHERSPETKAELARQASERFAISRRGFDRAWGKAIEATGAGWDKPGRPPGNPRA